MAKFRARQVAAITDAIAAARLALRARDTSSVTEFAEIFVREGGVQIPGEPDSEAAQAAGEAVLAVLREGRASKDPVVKREVARVQQESSWLEHSRSERVVGFRLCVDEAAREDPTIKTLLKADHGLGAGVFRKYSIVVLPPVEVQARFEPVYADELEC